MAFNRAVDTIEEDTKPRAKFVRNYDWFKLEEGTRGIYRFLQEGDEVLSVRTHQSIPTKKKPEGATKWPSSLPAVCRYDPAFDGIHSDCYVCDEQVISPWTDKPITSSPRYWILAMELEEVRVAGVFEGYKPIMVEREIDGKKVKMPKIVVINLGAKNFFSALLTTFKLDGSITDQAFTITRTGSSTATNYTPSGTGRERNAKGIPYSKRGTPDWWEENFGKYLDELGVNLEDIVSDQASDERYARFFDPRVTVTESKDSGEAFVPPADEGVDPQDLRAMAERVRGYSKV
jgi:hypothetical protein